MLRQLCIPISLYIYLDSYASDVTQYQTISYLHKLNMDDGATEMSHNFSLKNSGR